MSASRAGALGAFVLLGVAIAASCGGKVTWVEGSNGGGGEGPAQLDCNDVSFDFDAPITMCGTTGDLCTISGVLPDGRLLRESCSGPGSFGCELFVDNVKVCTCPSKDIDFSNTCANGVPVCGIWKIDFSDVSACL